MKSNKNERLGVEVFMTSDKTCVNCGDKINFCVDICNNTDRYLCGELVCLLPKGLSFLTGKVETPQFCYPLIHLNRIKLGDIMCGDAARVAFCAVVCTPPCCEIFDFCGHRPKRIFAYFNSAAFVYSRITPRGECKMNEKLSNIVTILLDDNIDNIKHNLFL